MFLIFRTSCGTTELTAPEVRHARARRLTDGAHVFVGDGAGKRARGTLSGTSVIVSGEIETALEPALRLFTAIPEPSRFDWMLQKCTELGACEFFPVLCERSERRSIRVDRAEKIILEAAVQSGRFVLPRIHEPMRIEDALQRTSAQAYLLTPGSGKWLEGSGPADFWVGPEGGFSPVEMEQLSSLTRAAISAHILRVETAAMAALARFAGPARETIL